MSTVMATLKTSIAGRIVAVDSTLLPLSYTEDVAKNNLVQAGNRYAVRPLDATEVPGVTRFVTLDQTFEILLTNQYFEDKISDAKKVTASLDCRAKLLDIYKDLVQTKAGSPSLVLQVRDLEIQSPEFLESEKVVVQRATVTVTYRLTI